MRKLFLVAVLFAMAAMAFSQSAYIKPRPADSGGTTNTPLPGQIPYFVDESGALTNSVMAQSQYNIGIGLPYPTFHLHVVAATDPGAITLDGYGVVGVNFMGRRARGTFESPSAVQQDDNLAALQGRGYGDTGFSLTSRGYVKIFAAENWHDLMQGTYVVIGTTPTGGIETVSTPAIERMRVDSSGNVGIGTTTNNVPIDSPLTVVGVIHSTTGGIMFPDGTTQTTATIAGPQGVTGAQGPQGIQGPQGDVGPQGPQGIQGLPGTAGAQGLTGPQGPQGATGAQGIQGPQGPQGATGAQGPQGLTGMQGDAGPAGTNGVGFYFRNAFDNSATYAVNDVVTLAGSTYVATVASFGPNNTTPDVSPSWTLMAQAGATGPQGATGAQGPQGVAGPQGDIGPQGPQGLQGPQGVAGPQGIQGPQGDIGPAGPQGATGAQGPQGLTGMQGPAGTPAPTVKDANGNVLGSLLSISGTDVTLYSNGYVITVGIGGQFPSSSVYWDAAGCSGNPYLNSGANAGNTHQAYLFARNVYYSAQANTLLVPYGSGSLIAAADSSAPITAETPGVADSNGQVPLDGASSCGTPSTAYNNGWALTPFDPVATLGWTLVNGAGAPLAVAGPLQLP